MFPPWQAVYKSFSRWDVAGVFEAMHDRLHRQWRDRVGKAPGPTAAVIGAQSTRSTAQGGLTQFAEHTYAWNEHARRLIAHHDRSAWAPLACVWLAEGRVFATRLAAKLISSTPSQAVPRPFVEFARHLRWLCLSAPIQS